MASRFIGVDLGNSGAVAVWDGRRDSLPSLSPFPLKEDDELDATRFASLLRAAGDPAETLVVFEQVFKPLSLVRKQGAVQAICDEVGVESEAAAVVTWKKRVLSVSSNDKQISVNKAKELWPEINLRRTARSRTDWHDAAEACLLAHYGSLLNGDGLRSR